MRKITQGLLAIALMLCCYTTKTQAQALNFGAYSYITLGDILPDGQSYTKEAWIRIHSIHTTHGCNILSSWDFPFWLENGVLSGANGYGNGAVITVQDAATIPLETWVHVAVTYDAPTTTMKLYKNGVLVAANSSAPTYITGDLQIGAQESGDFFDGGDIDEVRLWSVALTQSQIQTNMNCDVPQQSNLAAYYRFDQGVIGLDNTAITVVYDYSGNTHCGTMQNFNLVGATSNYIAGAISSCSTIPVAIGIPSFILGPSSVCSGSSITLSNGLPGGLWTLDDIDTADISSDGVLTGHYAGSVKVSYATCGGIATKNITVNQSPVLTGTAATGTITTSVAGVGTSYTYSWSNGASAPVIAGLSAGTYSVTVTDNNGCTAVGSFYTAPAAVTLAGSISITPSNNIYTGGNKHNIFLGYGPQNAVLTDNVTGASSLTYSWSPSTRLTNSHTKNPTFTPATAGTYTYSCTATTPTGYSLTTSVTLCVSDIVDHAHAGKVILSHVSDCNHGHADALSMKIADIAKHLCRYHLDHLGTITSCGAGLRTTSQEESTQMLLMTDEPSVSAYPNPFNDNITIAINGNPTETADITIYDLAGRVVEQKLGQPAGASIIVGHDLANGMYIAEIKHGDFTKKLKMVKAK